MSENKSENKAEKLVIIVTHGPEDPEKASLPFVVANAAMAMDVEVTVILQAKGVLTAKKGIYEHIVAPGLEPLKKMVDDFMRLGGKLFICIPCIEERHISIDMMVEGAQPIKAGRLVHTVLEAKAVLNY